MNIGRSDVRLIFMVEIPIYRKTLFIEKRWYRNSNTIYEYFTHECGNNVFFVTGDHNDEIYLYWYLLLLTSSLIKIGIPGEFENKFKIYILIVIARDGLRLSDVNYSHMSIYISKATKRDWINLHRDWGVDQ